MDVVPINRIVLCPHCHSQVDAYVDSYDMIMHRCGVCGQWLGLRITNVDVEVLKATIEKV